VDPIAPFSAFAFRPKSKGYLMPHHLHWRLPCRVGGEGESFAAFCFLRTAVSEDTWRSGPTASALAPGESTPALIKRGVPPG